MNETYPQYVSTKHSNPNKRLRASTRSELQQKVEEASGEPLEVGDYYVVDPTHSVEGIDATHNICNPDDDELRRLRTLALLAPQLLPSHTRQYHSLHSLTAVKNTRERLREDSDFWYEYLRRQASFIPSDNKQWSLEHNELTTDPREMTVIRAIRVAKRVYDDAKREGAKGKKRFPGIDNSEFTYKHVQHAIETKMRSPFAVRSEVGDITVTQEEVIRLIREKTSPPLLPHTPEMLDAMTNIISFGHPSPSRDGRTTKWVEARGYHERTPTMTLQSFEGYNTYDPDMLNGLLWGAEMDDPLESAYRNAIGETFPVWACGGCGETFPTNRDYNDHASSDCPSDEAICIFCNDSFTGNQRQRRLGNHKASQHPNKINNRHDPEVRVFLERRAAEVRDEEYHRPELKKDKPTPEPEPEPEPEAPRMPAMHEVYADGATHATDYEDVGDLAPAEPPLDDTDDSEPATHIPDSLVENYGEKILDIATQSPSKRLLHETLSGMDDRQLSNVLMVLMKRGTMDEIEAVRSFLSDDE